MLTFPFISFCTFWILSGSGTFAYQIPCFLLPSLSWIFQCQDACLQVGHLYGGPTHSFIHSCIIHLTFCEHSLPCAEHQASCWQSEINMAVSHGSQTAQSSRRESPIHKSLSHSVLNAVMEDCSGDTKKAETGGRCRSKKLWRRCFKTGCRMEHSSSAEEEHCFSYLLQNNKSVQNWVT